MNFGLTSLAAPNAASLRVARYSLTARLAALAAHSLLHSAPGIERCLFASAAIRLASTANPLRRRPALPQCTFAQHARRDGGKCRCREAAHCVHARTQSGPGPCLRLKAHKTSDKRDLLAHRGTALAPSGWRTHSRQSACGSSALDQSRADHCWDNEAPARHGPMTDR